MKTNPKISSNTHQFWKTPKPRLNHEMHETKRIRSLPSKEKLEKAWRILEEEVWRKGECLGEEQSRTDRERSKKWETDRERGIYRPFNNARQLRYREVSRKLSREVLRKWSSTAEVSSNKESVSRTEAQSIHQVSRSYRGDRSFLDRSTRYRGGVEIVLRKKLEKLDK